MNEYKLCLYNNQGKMDAAGEMELAERMLGR
jgi:hypothetical protein